MTITYKGVLWGLHDQSQDWDVPQASGSKSMAKLSARSYDQAIHGNHMGMALKTLWIARWSGRPDVTQRFPKAPTRRSCFHDMTSYVYMSLWLDQRSHGKVERSIPARPGIVFTLRIQLDCKHSCYRWQLTWVPKLMDCEPRVWRKERNQTITSFNTELVVVWIGAGCGLDRVWIGLDPGLDLPRSGPTCVCMLQLGCSMTRKGRQGVQAASVQLGCLPGWPCNLQQCQLCSLTAWMRNSCSLAAWQLGSVALQQFVAWLLGRVNNCRAGNPKTCSHHWTKHQLTNTLYHSKGLDQRSGSNPFERSGSEVWIGGLDRVWDRGLIQTLRFEPQPYCEFYFDQGVSMFLSGYLYDIIFQVTNRATYA